MIVHLTTILGFQLLGEILVRSLGLPVPGPVLGMALLLGLFVAVPRTADAIRPTAQTLLAHLSLLFVPAGVGVVGHLARLGGDGPAIGLALLASTVIAIAVGALVFQWVARLVGAEDA